MRVDEALRRYREFVEQHRPAYRILLAAQKVVPGLPMAWIEALAGLVEPEERIGAVMRLYWKTISPEALGWPAGEDGIPSASSWRSISSIQEQIEAD